MKKPICPYCGKDSELVRGREVYPHLPVLADKLYYKCFPCQAWVGTHKGTMKPLGNLAKAQLRKLKMRAHEVFDVLWRSRMMSRTEAYALMAEELKIKVEDAHIGLFSEEQCREVIRIFEPAWKRFTVRENK